MKDADAFGVSTFPLHLSLLLNTASTHRPRACRSNVTSQEFSQPTFQAYFSRRAALRFQPLLEVSQVNLMFNLGLPDYNRNRLPAPNVIDPIVGAKHPKALSHRFVERIRSDLDSMLAPPKIDARNAAIARPTAEGINTLRRFFARDLEGS